MDAKVNRLFITAMEADSWDDIKVAIQSLGKLARSGNSDAARALRQIAKEHNNSRGRNLAIGELGGDIGIDNIP